MMIKIINKTLLFYVIFIDVLVISFISVILYI